MNTIPGPIDYFPKERVPREKQVTALKFFQRAIDRGYKHIVIAAPTGSGKTLIGAAVCLWAPHSGLEGHPGGYYLATQKMLQDQLEKDCGLIHGASIKNAAEYRCPVYKTCALGLKVKTNGGCHFKNDGSCTYRLQKEAFYAATVAITNYPFMLTEQTTVAQLPARQVLIADECHTIEKQLIRMFDLVITEETLNSWTPEIQCVPKLPTMTDAVDWVTNEYLPTARSNLEAKQLLAESDCDKFGKDAAALDQHINKVVQTLKLITNSDDDEWVYWQERDAKNHNVAIIRPLNAAPYFPTLSKVGNVKLYMSAYPGKQEVFCQSLGLNMDEVAWCGLSSTFPKENRPIVMAHVGSMSQRNVSQTLPNLLRMVDRIIEKHKTEKGIIHGHSYRLCEQIFNHLMATQHAKRLLFPRNGDERNEKFNAHKESNEPTVLISPSIAEGFDFIDDLARWQILAKCPFLSLGDKQIVAKRAQNNLWYRDEAIKTFIQASGRICRSDTDRGVTYVLDSDFMMLLDNEGTNLPRWFSDAFVWLKPRSRSTSHDR